jgi:hypothetical protein
MSYPKFLDKLLHSGEVRLTDAIAPTDTELQRGSLLLAAFEKTWRLELPGTAPAFSPVVASWAAASFFRAVQLLLFRDLPADEICSSFESACPPCDPVDKHYSVDMIFRFLPDLWKFSQAAAEQDPLSLQLKDWCIQWPLSSVGAQNILTAQNDSAEFRFEIDEFADNDCLMQVYIDRIVSHADASRMNDQRVIKRLHQSAGMYPELTGKLLNNMPS